MSGYRESRRQDARLIILKAIAAQADERLSSSFLQAELQRFMIDEPREWLHAELDWMESMGVVTLLRPEGASVVIASLTETGARHLRRGVVVPGIARPARPEA